MATAEILCHDAEMSLLLSLLLSDNGYSDVRISDTPSDVPPTLTVVDLDTVTPPSARPAILFSRENVRSPYGFFMRRPFLSSVFVAEAARIRKEAEENGILTPIPDKNTVLLGGNAVKLSPEEYRLFAVLYESRGNCVPKERLLSVLSSDSTDGLLPVYIHYLRRKIEADGKRRLFSLRGRGYLLKVGEGNE